jgi:hypothetical protein
MIRISPTARPEAWHDIEVEIDGQTAPMRVRYWLLSKQEAAEWTKQRLALAKAVRTENEAETFDRLLDELSPEQFQRADTLLRARILDWNLVDADSPDGARLPVNEQTLSAILDQTRFWRPLLQGLVDASSGVAAKKTGSTGSAGGSTTSSRD